MFKHRRIENLTKAIDDRIRILNCMIDTLDKRLMRLYFSIGFMSKNGLNVIDYHNKLTRELISEADFVKNHWKKLNKTRDNYIRRVYKLRKII